MPSTPRVLLPVITVILAIALILAVALKGSPSHTGASDGAFDGAVLPQGIRAPDFTLSDQDGRRVSLSDYREQVVVLAFLSPDCRACALVAQQVRGALDELGPGRDVRTVFVSTDPGASRARIGRLLAETSLTGRAEYLTGTANRLRPLWHAYRVPPPSAGKATSEAAITVLLIDREGFERVGFGLEQITPEGLAHDIRLLEGA